MNRLDALGPKSSFDVDGPAWRIRVVMRVSDEVRSTCAQAQLCECLVIQRMVGGTWVFESGGGGG